MKKLSEITHTDYQWTQRTSRVFLRLQGLITPKMFRNGAADGVIKIDPVMIRLLQAEVYRIILWYGGCGQEAAAMSGIYNAIEKDYLNYDSDRLKDDSFKVSCWLACKDAGEAKMFWEALFKENTVDLNKLEPANSVRE
jgi:hypothetical protein